MIYASLTAVKDDMAWLTQQCSLPAFAAARLSSYELALKQAEITLTEDKAVLACYAGLFATIGLKAARWTNPLSHVDLPVLALRPNEGVRVLFEQEAGGEWKSEGKTGVRSQREFPQDTLFTPIKELTLTTGKTTATTLFKSIAWQQKPIFMYAVIASLAINLLALGTSFFSMQVYDRVIPTQGLSTLLVLGIGVFVAILLEMLLKLSRSHILDHATQNMDIAYSHDIFQRFLKIRLDAMPKSVGTLSGQLQSYSTVRAFIASAAMYMLIDFPFALLFLSVIVMLSGWLMGAVVLGFLCVAVIAGTFFRKKIETLSKTSSMASNKKLGLLVESVEAAESIKATGAGWSILNRWNALTEYAIHDDLQIRHYSEMSSYVTAFLQQLSYVALVALGAYLVSTTENLTMGGLIAVTILSGRVLAPIAMLPNLLVQWGRTKIGIEDLNRIYALDRDNENVERPLSPQQLVAHFRCENVAFSYTGNTPTVAVAKLTIAPGERVAVLGTIGSGKSTLLKILAGLYKPQSGQVFINGMDLHHISRHRLNEAIGYLPQTVKLISGTLRDNLLLGLTGIDDEAIMAVAKQSGLIQLINGLPKGLDTAIPEGGESVSGGQKQMIAMTRLLLMKPQAWLLDEPTANMDDNTERQILGAINRQLTPQNTLILVTHKPALLALVSRIVVIAPQGIVLDGSRDAVLQKLKEGNMPKSPVSHPQPVGVA